MQAPITKLSTIHNHNHMVQVGACFSPTGTLYSASCILDGWYLQCTDRRVIDDATDRHVNAA